MARGVGTPNCVFVGVICVRNCTSLTRTVYWLHVFQLLAACRQYCLTLCVFHCSSVQCGGTRVSALIGCRSAMSVRSCG